MLVFERAEVRRGCGGGCILGLVVYWYFICEIYSSLWPFIWAHVHGISILNDKFVYRVQIERDLVLKYGCTPHASFRCA